MSSFLPRVSSSLIFWPALIAAGEAILVLAWLDPAGDHPHLGAGPGVTVDEPLNVRQGVQLADRLFSGDLAGFRALDAALPDYPPLGRVWIGVCHELAFLAWPPVDSQGVPYSITCARTASALAFAATLFFVGWFAARWFGRSTGAWAALALLLMPRTFGHAHLASLETCINLAYALVVFYLADRWGERVGTPSEGGGHGVQRPPGLKTAIVGGVLLGLALLIKIQAVLLPIPIALWGLLALKKRGLLLVPILGIVGLLVLFVGWPYLWDAPVDHLRQYLGRTTERAVIYAWYGGQSVADRALPWHYPWAFWWTTVPLGLHAAGVWGLWRSLRDPQPRLRALLLAACCFFPILLFSIPGIAVYDGERLFSVSYPLWAVFIGCGTSQLVQWAARQAKPRLATLGLAALLGAQSGGLWRMAPCWLSYYNLLVGGISGAQSLGLPTTYWGDGVTRTFLEEVASQSPEGATIAVAPELYNQQWNELLLQSPPLNKRQIRFAVLGTPAAAQAELLLIVPRREYLPEDFRQPFDPEQIVAAVRREGVVLAALLRRTRDAPP
ncbi:MAG: hypothetical protein ACKV0T_17705 [Planctomycetales bacterium]